MRIWREVETKEDGWRKITCEGAEINFTHVISITQNNFMIGEYNKFDEDWVDEYCAGKLDFEHNAIYLFAEDKP